MTQKDNILQELKELNSSLAVITPLNSYSVPVGYFDGLAARVLNRIKAIEAENAKEEIAYLSPELSSIAKQMPYAVPHGYFETLAENALQSLQERNYYKAAKEETESLSPLLAGLKKEMPYSVPVGYFENLGKNISKEENKAAAKVISITSRKWFRYAAAAVVTGIIIMTGVLLTGNDKKELGGKALAKFTQDVKKMDDVQKDNLIDFIDLNNKETAQVDIGNKTDEVKTLLQGISEEELNDFQEQTEDMGDVLMTN